MSEHFFGHHFMSNSPQMAMMEMNMKVNESTRSVGAIELMNSDTVGGV
jgi:hypothetical protein